MYIIQDKRGDVHQEKRLMFAVLQRGIEDALSDHGIERKYREQANEWIDEIEPEGLKEKFTFEWICEQLDLDVSRMREVINVYRNKQAPYLGMSSMSIERAYRKISHLDDPSGLHYLETAPQFSRGKKD